MAGNPIDVLDPNGDLTLRVHDMTGTTITDLKVSSQKLTESSRYFSSMLGDEYAERRPADGRRWIVDMHEVDTALLPKVLDYVHSKNSTPFAALNEDDFYDVVCIIDYLCCQQELKDLASTTWTAEFEARVQAGPQISARLCEPFLYMAIYMGLEDLAKNLLTRVQRDVLRLSGVQYSQNGVLFFDRALNRFTLETDIFSPLLADFVFWPTIKQRTIEIALIETDTKSAAVRFCREKLGPFFPQNQVGQFVGTRTATCRSPRAADTERIVCHYTLSGSLWDFMRNRRLSLHDLSTEKYRAWSWADCLKRLKRFSMIGREVQPRQNSHSCCNPVPEIRAELDRLDQRFRTELQKYEAFEFTDYQKEFFRVRNEPHRREGAGES